MKMYIEKNKTLKKIIQLIRVQYMPIKGHSGVLCQSWQEPNPDSSKS